MAGYDGASHRNLKEWWRKRKNAVGVAANCLAKELFWILKLSALVVVHTIFSGLQAHAPSLLTAKTTIKMLTKKKVNESETIITVGPYRIPVKRAAFQEWEAKLMSEAGFTDREIKAEILRRLGYAKN